MRGSSSLRIFVGSIVTLCTMMSVCWAANVPAPLPRGRRVVGHISGYLNGATDSPMTFPTDVAVDGAGRVIVVDGVHGRLLVFGRDGALKAVWRGPDEGLVLPVGVGVGPDDHVFVADVGHRRIVEFDPSGRVVNTIELPRGAIGPGAPRDVAVRDGQIYISDGINQHLWVGPLGGALKALGAKGKALGQFSAPFAIWLAPDGYVFVSEVLSATIQRIAGDGKWSGRLANFGVGPGELYRPKGIAGDGKGRLFVADSSLGVVQVFDVRGGFIGVLTDAKGAPLRFAHPMGVAYAADGHLYVVELRAHRVAVVTLEGRK